MPQDARASAYEHWRSLFDEQQDLANAAANSHASGGAFDSQHTRRRLVGRRWDIAAVPQMLDYERGSDLELWELWSAS